MTTEYFEYFNKTYKIVDTSDGGSRGYLLNLKTGAFDVANNLIRKVTFATSESDISRLDKEDFVDQTERHRDEYLQGDGPIFAIYETIAGMHQQIKAENRSFTAEERALIKTLRKRTFAMWEEEFARRAAGDPPTFQYTSKLA